MKAVIITPEEVKPFVFKGKEPSLNEMQEAVGGLIEVVPTFNPDKIMIVNEEGLFKDFEINEKATSISRIGVPIMGNAIYMDAKLFK